MPTLADYVQARKMLEVEQFVTRHPDPVLLTRHSEPTEPDAGYHTSIHPSGTGLEFELGLTTQPDLEVIPIRKRIGGPFSDRIGVGRTPNTDVTLRFADISKYHAYLYWDETGSTVHLVDAGSSNGTFVDGEPLPPKTSAVLDDRTIVSFGRHHFRFHTPSGLYKALTELAYGEDSQL